MIYTVTLNSSLDYIVSVDDFRLGRTNRTSYELMLPGGKGLNVSMVLKHLGLESVALGFVAGFTGEEICREIIKQGIREEFIRLNRGNSRINLKLRSVDGTEINGQGPDIEGDTFKRLLLQLNQLQEGDVLILAGSIPVSMEPDSYQRIMKFLEGRGVMVVVDATRELLLNVLEYRPFLIKPNRHELSEIFEQDLTDRADILSCAKRLQERGAANVLVSMGGEGALLAAADGSCYEAPAPEGMLVNSVGSGDSMVAGFLAGWLRSGNYAEAFRMGVAAGSASAFSEYLATEKEIQEVYQRVCPENC